MAADRTFPPVPPSQPPPSRKGRPPLKGSTGQTALGQDQRQGQGTRGMMQRQTVRMGLIAVAFGAIGAAHAQGQIISPPMALGAGLSTCEAWSQARASGAAGRQAMSNWVFGFLTGIQWGDPLSEELQKWSSENLLTDIDKTCRENPLSTVSEAASGLMVKLRIGEAIEEALRQRQPHP